MCRFMQPLVSKVPIMVIEGNHEIELQAENKAFEAYNARFGFPSQESGSSSNFYYSFSAGGIHFLMLGAYISYNKSCKTQDSFSSLLPLSLYISVKKHVFFQKIKKFIVMGRTVENCYTHLIIKYE